MKTTKGSAPLDAPKFDAVFTRLKEILQQYSRRLSVTVDTNDHYCLNVDFSPKFGKGFPVAWVKTGKRYISFHFMPIYMFPQLKDGLSASLRARMQGRSCFNFSTIDEALFKELEALAAAGLRLSEEKGVLSRPAGSTA